MAANLLWAAWRRGQISRRGLGTLAIALSLGSSAIACLVPAARAAYVNPMQTLRFVIELPLISAGRRVSSPKLPDRRLLGNNEIVTSELPVIRTKLRSGLIRRSRIPVWPQNQIRGSWVHFLVQSLS